jgi:hypothetical protein
VSRGVGRAIENAKSNAGKFVLAVSKWGAARRIGVPVVRLFALGAGSWSSPAGPVRGTLRLSPAQVLELDEVPPFILELHARAASERKREKKGEGKRSVGGLDVLERARWSAGGNSAGRPRAGAGERRRIATRVHGRRRAGRSVDEARPDARARPPTARPPADNSPPPGRPAPV